MSCYWSLGFVVVLAISLAGAGPRVGGGGVRAYIKNLGFIRAYISNYIHVTQEYASHKI